MESPQLLGVTEECCSNESGWTMYIASPMHDDDDHDDDDEDDEDDDVNDDDHSDNDDHDDSDDSMVSDASTGPSHHEHPYGNGEGGHGMAPFKHDHEEDDNKYYSNKKADKKRDEESTDAEKQDSVLMANSSTCPLPSGTKVRKTRRFDKGK